jgi:hypothetical protein
VRAEKVLNLKNAKKELILLIISLLLLAVFCFIFFKIEPTAREHVDQEVETETSQDSLISESFFSDKYYYNQLSTISKREFRKIYEGICNYESSIVVDGLSVQDLNQIIYILYFDCPELFYLSDNNQNFNHVNNKATVFYPQYTYTKETVDKMKEELDEIAADFKKKLKNQEPEYIEKYIHDYLISNVTYNQETDNYMNIYGALIEGKANCKGYSSSFVYLARSLNLPSAQVIGYASDNNASIGHSWNVVELGDTYYYLDVCWDDFDESSEYGNLAGSYIFYNLPANKMAVSHNPEETFTKLGTPPTDNDSSKIYYKELGYYASDIIQAKEIIHTQIGKVDKGEAPYVILQCDTQEVYNSVINNIQSIIKAEIEMCDSDFSECSLIEISKANTILLVNFSAD